MDNYNLMSNFLVKSTQKYINSNLFPCKALQNILVRFNTAFPLRGVVDYERYISLIDVKRAGLKSCDDGNWILVDN